MSDSMSHERVPYRNLTILLNHLSDLSLSPVGSELVWKSDFYGLL